MTETTEWIHKPTDPSRDSIYYPMPQYANLHPETWCEILVNGVPLSVFPAVDDLFENTATGEVWKVTSARNHTDLGRTHAYTPGQELKRVERSREWQVIVERVRKEV